MLGSVGLSAGIVLMTTLGGAAAAAAASPRRWMSYSGGNDVGRGCRAGRVPSDDVDRGVAQLVQGEDGGPRGPAGPHYHGGAGRRWLRRPRRGAQRVDHAHPVGVLAPQAWRARPVEGRTATMVLTAPIASAGPDTSSSRPTTSTLSGMVTDAPPKSGARMARRRSSARSVSQSE